MSNEDDQAEELEVLASIFPVEFQLIEGKDKCFTITLAPHPPGGEENHVAISLLCEFPPNYPSDGPPILTIKGEKGLSATQVEELQTLADSSALENVGMASIFTVTEVVKEWLADNNIAGQDGSMYSEMMRRMQQKDVEQKKETAKAAIRAAADSELNQDDVSVDPEELERIRKRQAGRQVTLETFNEWKRAFDQEMLALAIQQQKEQFISEGQTDKASENMAAAKLFLDPATGIVVCQDDSRMSGKQYFLSGASKGTDDADEEALILQGESEDISCQLKGDGEGGGDDDDDDYDNDDDDEDYVPSDDGGDADGPDSEAVDA